MTEMLTNLATDFRTVLLLALSLVGLAMVAMTYSRTRSWASAIGAALGAAMILGLCASMLTLQQGAEEDIQDWSKSTATSSGGGLLGGG